ncbi:DUF547 domain-containing protein [Pontibacter sp. H249]|uniref:DUF547 domain-containing protein n=1 Tax=Pontibacter sp. H249 TaxID=3133420 RepID=UPI0030C471DD
MHKLFFLLIILCTAHVTVPGYVNNAYGQQQEQNMIYTSVTTLLQRHVANGQIKFKQLQRDRPLLKELVKQIAAFDLSRTTASEKKAFYINAYNVLVLKQVIDHYPINSVMDIPGFFDKQKYKVAGESLTLNELEHKKLREPYKDARLHFALVCAAKSCPPLLSTAYTPQQVEKQLEAQTRKALQDKTFTRVQPQQKQVQVSELFKWYKDDYLAEAPTIIAYINKYRASPIPESYKLSYYTYDWQLNDAGR